jgi:hypothetical protein
MARRTSKWKKTFDLVYVPTGKFSGKLGEVKALNGF